MFTKIYWTNERKKPKFNFPAHVRAADSRRTFSKGDTTNWSFKFYKITEIIIDKKPSYRFDNLTERHNEALLKKNTANNERKR